MMIHNTIQKDPTKSTEEALMRVYLLLRGSEAPSAESAEKFINRMFFFPKKYDLGQVGRYRLDKQFNLNNSGNDSVLTHDDFLITLKYLIQMRKGLRAPDDIDHLGNRRVRTVGEQLKVQFNSALARMVRTVYERMNLRESETITPQDLINSRLVTTVINTFFGTSQLSQFGDQTNPLAEITHKRRISSLGPGGLSRERAGFEVRDVHYTHYGRLCPIETPEGPNIGLISSLALMAKINRHGFIEAPYRKIDSKKITNSIEYLSADDEDRANIAQSGLKSDKNNLISDSKVRVRSKGDFPIVDSKDVQYSDIVPNQILSVAAALIPFVEHDDANRALMGSNMQRQSVPLLKTDSPIVGTGMEKVVARDSKSVLLSPVSGKVVHVDANKVVIKDSNYKDGSLLKADEDLCTVDLIKYSRSNQNTCYNQKVLVKVGDNVKKDEKLLAQRLKGKSVKDFNIWFNKMFEKVKMKEDASNSGYETWFRSDEDVVDEKASSLGDFDRLFHNRKNACRELVVKKDLEEMTSQGGYSLNRNKPEHYSSGVFSKLAYEDLKKAHTETVVPVTQEDYYNKEKYGNVQDIKTARARQNVAPLTQER